MDVDIRPRSPTQERSVGFELSDLNVRMTWRPPGYAQGFFVLGNEPLDVLHEVDAPYNRADKGGICGADQER